MLKPELITNRNEKLAIDIVGPLPLSRHKMRYIFTAMELASAYPFAIPLPNYTAASTAKSLLSIIAILGTPLVILSDQGTNFLSTTVSHLYNKFGIQRMKTAPYRPQSNGKLERFHGTLKVMLSKCISNKLDWPDAIDLVLYFCRNMPQSRHGFTPQEILFLKPSPHILSTLKSIWSTNTSSNLNLPQFIEDMDKIISLQLQHVKSSLASKHCQSRIDKESALVATFRVGDIVFRRIPGLNGCLEASWDGPFVVHECIPPLNCSIKPQGSVRAKPKVVHISQLKKSHPVNRALMIPDENDTDLVTCKHNVAKSIPLTESQQNQLSHVLDQFPSVFTDKPGLTTLTSYSITLTCITPVWSPTYSIPIAHQEAFRQEIDNLLDLDIIEPSTSKYSSSPMPVAKKDGGIRIVIDFKKLNAITVREPFTMPSVEDIISKLGSATVLSKIDLQKGFHQVPMEHTSKQYTAFHCLQGKFQYKVMPFGLTNAPGTFQLLMQQVLRGLDHYSLPYIDDIVIYSSGFEEHIHHVASVLLRLSSANLTVKKSKCSWCFSTFDFLGFHVGEGMISIPQARITQFSQYKIPTTRTSLKSFLGLVTFYSKFVPQLANLTTILNSHMPKDNHTKITITEEYQSAFDKVISGIVNHAALIIPNITDSFSIFTDASTSGIGGTLCIYKDSSWQPCSFYSRQLLPREKNYSILDLEALAVLATVHHYHYYLSGTYFKIFTDHKPLVHIFGGNPPSARLIRWKIKLAEYSFDIVHISGHANNVADAMSRQSWTTTEMDEDLNLEEGGDVVEYPHITAPQH